MAVVSILSNRKYKQGIGLAYTASLPLNACTHHGTSSRADEGNAFVICNHYIVNLSSTEDRFWESTTILLGKSD